MPATQNVLEVIELTKVFRDFWGRESVKALDGLNFDVKPGEVFGLLGPNGSGKTTTVRIILGLLFPTRGAVRVFGQSPRRVDVKKRIGYMPEESHLYSYLTAEETLDFFGRLFRLPPAERRRRRDALIEMVGLQRARRRPIGQYSKGMARRIGLAQALINDPDLLILDEPTTGLDPIGAREMKDLILKLRERGKTIFICSHLLADVEEICDRVCILYGGIQRALGPVDELLSARDATQIIAPRMDQEALDRVLGTIREVTGGADARVSTPRRRLEEFFLDVVEQARRERLATTGAERGVAPAAFLLGQEEPEGEKLVEELVQAAREESEPPAPAGPEPVAAIPVERDDELIARLVQQGSAPEEPQNPEPEREPGSAVPDQGIKRDVIDELLTDGNPDDEEDSGEAR